MKVNTIALRFIHLFMILLTIFCPQTQIAASVKVEMAPEKPQNEFELYQQRFLKYQQKCPEQFQYFCFDDVLDLIDEFEYGDPEESRSEEELDEIVQFISFLAEEGVFPGETEKRYALSTDIRDLMNSGSSSSFEWVYGVDNGIVISPVVFNDNWEIILSKNPFTKRWEKAKKFIKKHKKEIIIGAAIVVAVTVVVVAAVVISSAAATTAATASAGAIGGTAKPATANSEDASTNNSSHSASSSTSLETESIIPQLEDRMITFNEQTAQSSSGYPEIDSFTLMDQTREFTSYLVHDVVDAVSELTECVPQALSEVREFGEKIFPNGPSSNDFVNYSASDTHREKITACHEAVDDFFSTDFSSHYNTEDLWMGRTSEERGEADAFLSNFKHEYAVGWIPPPGLGKLPIGKLKGRIPITQPSPVRGWRVGEDVKNLTSGGHRPTWSTVRRRHWKNTAYEVSQGKVKPIKFECTERNMSRMKRGLAPQKFVDKTGKWESMELHHTPPQRDGGLFDFEALWPSEHAEVDGYRRLGKK